jgi:hypothetical protein
VLLSNITDPSWNSGGEKQDLKLLLVYLSHLLENVINILFEPKLEHDVGFVQNDSLEIREIDVVSTHMIFDPSGGTNENIDTPFEVLGLAIDADTSVDCHNLELVGMMLQLGKLSGNLNRQLSGGC